MNINKMPREVDITRALIGDDETITLDELLRRSRGETSKEKERDVVEKTLDRFAVDYCNAVTENHKKRIDGYAWEFLAKTVEAPECKAIYFSYYQSKVRVLDSLPEKVRKKVYNVLLGGKGKK
jgi:hypothetical protein